MADGFDGFTALKGRKALVDHETGTSISNIIRSFLLGSAYIMRKKTLMEDQKEFDASSSQPANQAAPEKGATGAQQAADQKAQYFGTKTPLVLQKHRAQAQAQRNAGARPAGTIDIPVELPGHMPGGTEDVRGGNTSIETDSSLVEVREVEFPLRDGREGREPAGHMPGSTLNVVTGQQDPLPKDEAQPQGADVRHIVQHDWEFIKEAIYLSKHEHMSDVDAFKGDSIRKLCPTDASATPTPAATGTATPAEQAAGAGANAGTGAGSATPSIVCDNKCRVELGELDGDIPIVSPLVDGRMHDVSGCAAQAQA